MRKSRLNSLKHRIFLGLILLVVSVCFSDCNRRPYLNEGEYLLVGQEIKLKKQAYQIQEDIDLIGYELETTYQQKLNSSLFIFSNTRYRLWMYKQLYKINRRRLKKGKDIRPRSPEKNWLWRVAAKVSESPVILDTILMDTTSYSMQNQLNHKGYFSARVTPTVKLNKKRKTAYVTYSVETNARTLIDTTYFYSKDSNIQRILNREAINSNLKKNEPLDILLFNAEKERLSTAIRNEGYEKFSWDYFKFEADTANARRYSPEKKKFLQRQEQGEPRVVVYVNVLPYSDTMPLHPFYKIRNVYVIPILAEESELKPHERRFIKKDTAFIYQNKYGEAIAFGQRNDTMNLIQLILRKKGGKSILREKLLAEQIAIHSGQLYSINNYKQTIRNLSEIEVFELADIQYKPVPGQANLLDCFIEMEPIPKQVLGSDAEINTFNTFSQNLGGATNITYRNRNLFRGAEVFSTQLQVGGVFRFKADTTQSVTPIDEQSFLDRYISLLDINFENSLYLPRFAGPKFLSRKMLNAKTRFAIGYRYLRQGIDLRISSIYVKLFSYEWQLKENIRHQFLWNPMQLSVNFEPVLSQNYQDKLRTSNPALLASLQSRFIIPSTDLSYTYNTPDKKVGNTWFLKLYAEIAGNLLYGLNEIVQPNRPFRLLNVDYSQFVKVDADLRHSIYISRRQSFVMRLMLGGVLPFGNSYSSGAPFPRRFFLGGPSSMRAWTLRQIGPGRVQPAAGIAFQLGDIRLEGNLEYRFKFNSWIGGAFFVDMGNVWLWRPDETNNNNNVYPPFGIRPTGVINKDFWKEMAIGTGFGLRLDFSFFIIRLDYGIQVYNPSGYGLQDNGKMRYWNEPQLEFRLKPFKNSNYVLGIGYPF